MARTASLCMTAKGVLLKQSTFGWLLSFFQTRVYSREIAFVTRVTARGVGSKTCTYEIQRCQSVTSTQLPGQLSNLLKPGTNHYITTQSNGKQTLL